MSRMTVMALALGEGTTDLKEFSNAWGGAPYVWDVFMPDWLKHHERLRDLWAEARNESRPIFERAMLALTFDHAYISRENFTEAAYDIEKFLAAHPPKPGNVNHWQAVADLLRVSDAPAICFHQTSVTENPWRGPWNEQREDYDPFDWSQAFEVYSALRAEREEPTP